MYLFTKNFGKSRKFSFGGNTTNGFRNQDIKSNQMGGTVMTIPASNSLTSSCELISRSQLELRYQDIVHICRCQKSCILHSPTPSHGVLLELPICVRKAMYKFLCCSSSILIIVSLYLNCLFIVYG